MWLQRYAVVALALGAKFSDVPVILSLSFSMAFLIAIAIFAWVGSIEFRVMRRMVAGEYLVRWTYTQKEWERFTEQSWEKSWKIHVWVLVALLLFALILALIVSQISATLMFVGIAVGYGLLLFGGDYWLYRQRRKQGAGEVLISRVGILRPEGFTLLLGLDTVKLEPGPQAIIQFTCQYRTTSRDGITNTSQKTFEVPVPHGKEAEAKRLVQQFQST